MGNSYEKLRKISKKFPNKPGVYFWRDKKGAPIYIGRAGSLKKRIASYFLDSRLRGNDKGTAHDPRIAEMVASAHTIDYETTDTLLEAVVLEANLIKKHWPKYNILEKDGKSFMYMVITDEEFPRILMARGRELERYSPNPSPLRGTPFRKGRIGALAVFGPYQSYYLLRNALEIVRRIFPYSNCRPPHMSLRGGNPPRQSRKSLRGWIASRTRNDRRDGSRVKPGMTEGIGQDIAKPCFHYQIGLCPGVCVGAIDAKTYRDNIRNIILFFRGDKKRLIKKLQKENSASAAPRRDGPDAIQALKQVEDTALLAGSDVILRGSTSLTTRRIEGYDISHLAGREPVGAMVVFENGNAAPDQYRLFKIRGAATVDDLAMLEEVLQRRLNHHEWPMPDIVFVDGGANQVRRAVKVLAAYNVHVPVVGLAKGGKHAASAYATDKLVIANAKKVGKELIITSKRLFQEVRNEAHRFAIQFQRRRTKRHFLK